MRKPVNISNKLVKLIRQLLTRILAFIGGIVSTFAVSLFVICVARFGFSTPPLPAVVSATLAISLIGSQVLPRRFLGHSLLILILLQALSLGRKTSPKKHKDNRKEFFGYLLIILYILAWIGLVGSAFVFSISTITIVISVISFLMLMTPFVLQNPLAVEPHRQNP